LPQYNAVFFNGNQNSLLKDKSVRRALTMGIDRRKIIKEALDGDGEIIDGPMLPGFLGDNTAGAVNLYDKTAAQKILADAGWILKDGEKYRVNKKKEKMKIALTTLDKGQNVKAAGIIKNNWEEMGVEVELKVISASSIIKDYIYNRKFEALLFGEMYGADLDPYDYWHSSAAKYPGLNLAQYSNTKADALLQGARKSSDKVVRQKKYQELQAILAEDFPAIFLWQPKYAYFVEKKVKGLQIARIVAPSDRFYHLASAYISTRRTLK
jgi:peptide/nickel transport system substrate-binding protein